MRNTLRISRKSICILAATLVLAVAFGTWWFSNRTVDGPSVDGHPLRMGTLTNSATVAVAAFIAALHDPDGAVRMMASTGLGKLGPAATDAIVSLQVALNDKNPQVRIDADRALRSIRSSEPTGVEKRE